MAILGQEGCSSYAGVLDNMVSHQACPHKPMKPNTCDCLGHNIARIGKCVIPCSTGQRYSSTGHPLVHYWAMLIQHWATITPALGNHYSSTGQPLLHYWAMLIQHWEPNSPLLGNVILCSTGQSYSSTGPPLVHCCALLFHVALGNDIPALGIH